MAQAFAVGDISRQSASGSLPTFAPSTNTMRHSYFLFLGILSLAYLLLPSCRKEVFTTNPDDKLAFSTDTLRFDTVFTELGSATRFFKLYNRSKKSLRIDKLSLREGTNSKFRLNVDGLPGRSFTALEIGPQDSMYVFAEVTINPDAPLSASPFVVSEVIDFETNGNAQVVHLEAWGQNANYIPSRFYADSLVSYSCNGGEWVWDDPRPYVIYGGLFIDECTVRMPAGTRVYIHGGLTRYTDDSTSFLYNDGILAFAGSGRLMIEGTADRPVVIQSDRLEQEFAEVGGQFAGVWLQRGTSGHKIEHAVFKHGITGLRVDSAADLTIRKTSIYHTSGSGLVGIHAKITAENCLFYDNGAFGIQLEYGGDYQFDYCTVASYGSGGESLKLSNALCLDQLCQDALPNPIRARFRNCIFLGDRNDQITLFDRFSATDDFDYQLTNCFVKVKDLIRTDAYPDFFTYCDPCENIRTSDTVFVKVNDYNFRLDTLHSKANGYGVPILSIIDDKDNKVRDVQRPDIGCFENEF